MATLTTALTVTSTDNTTDVLQLSVTDSLTTAEHTVQIARTTVSVVGASNIIQPDTSGATYYLYVKHTGTSDGSAATTENLGVELTGDVIVGKLSVGEWMFMPVGGHSLGVQLQSSTGTINAEYAYWTKG